MNITKPQLEYSLCENEAQKTPVIVVAAGNAVRMGGINKQTLKICDVPVIARTLLALEKSTLVSRIILVVKAEDVFMMQSICNEYNISKVSDIAEGGANRHESVICGMKRLTDNEKTVLIHDGARPFVTSDMIGDCVSALRENKGCLCAVKVSDTVKSADCDGKVAKTVDRSNLWLAQTPQGVYVKEYLEASEKYDKAEFTDDASVMEAAGYPVKIVAGEKTNIKITTPDDIAIAESFIKRGAV